MSGPRPTNAAAKDARDSALVAGKASSMESSDPHSHDDGAEVIARRLDTPVTVLGVVFVLLLVAESSMHDEARLRPWFDGAGWALWAVFVAEFLARMLAAPSTSRFLRRNWWQAVFLAVPFLRFLRVAGRLARLRPARLGRLASSAVRGVRTAGRTLSSRLAWLAAVTVIVALVAGQLLFEFGGYDSYGRALHDAAYATITGEPIPAEGALADVLELVLALYAVVVFGLLAGALGAYFLERSRHEPGAGAGAAEGRPAPPGRARAAEEASPREERTVGSA